MSKKGFDFQESCFFCS